MMTCRDIYRVALETLRSVALLKLRSLSHHNGLWVIVGGKFYGGCCLVSLEILPLLVNNYGTLVHVSDDWLLCIFDYQVNSLWLVLYYMYIIYISLLGQSWLAYMVPTTDYLWFFPLQNHTQDHLHLYCCACPSLTKLPTIRCYLRFVLFFSIWHFIFRFIDILIRFKTWCIFSKSYLNNTIFSFNPRFLLKLFTVHFFRSWIF